MPVRSVLVVSYEFSPVIGGAGRYAEELALGLDAAGATVSLLVGKRSAEARASLPLDVKSLGCDLPSGRMQLGKALAIGSPRLARATKRADTIVAVDWVAQLLVGRCSAVLRTPFAVAVLGSEVNAFANSRALGALARPVYRRARTMICISNYTSQLLKSSNPEVDPERVHVIPVPARQTRLSPSEDRDATRLALGFDHTSFLLLQVARLVPRKGHARVLNALSRLPSELRRQVGYVVTGEDGLEAELRTLARRLGLCSQVRFVGAVTDERLANLYAACDALVMPGEQVGAAVEGFGIAVQEAALAGRPSIGTAHGATPEVIENGVTGLLVTAGNEAELSDAIAALSRDRERASRMGQAALRRANVLYHPETVGKAVLRALESGDLITSRTRGLR